MGVKKFYEFVLEKMGYQPDRESFISVTHSLLVDIKNIMYRCAYHVSVDDPNFEQRVADEIKSLFGTFERVVFVNDGAIDREHAKYATACQRSEQRKEAVAKTSKRKAEMSVQPCVDEKEVEKLDRAMRAARGVSFEQSKSILALLAASGPNFECVQCEGEADDYIIKHHGKFDFVVSEDSDFLVGGVACLLRGMGTKDQAVYRTDDILKVLKLNLRQLQELAAMAGNDYTQIGIRGMGLGKAYALLLKYGSCRNMLAKWSFAERAKFIVAPDFAQRFNQSMLTYSAQNAMYLLDEPQTETDNADHTTETQQTQNQEQNDNKKRKFFDLFLTKESSGKK